MYTRAEQKEFDTGSENWLKLIETIKQQKLLLMKLFPSILNQCDFGIMGMR
jgi:hypothetical protein